MRIMAVQIMAAVIITARMVIMDKEAAIMEVYRITAACHILVDFINRFVKKFVKK